MSLKPDEFIKAMRRFPASVAIVAAGSGANRCGLTATAVCSVSADPPQVLVCLNAETRTCWTIKKTGLFSLNVLNSSQAMLARRFAGQEPGVSGEDKFSAGDWRQGDLDLPILGDAVFTFECRLVSASQAATHAILLGAVLHLPATEAESALVFRSGTYGTFAPLESSVDNCPDRLVRLAMV